MRRLVIAAIVAIVAFGGSAVADKFPSRPITVVVPFSAGGPSDTMMRILGERMKQTLGEEPGFAMTLWSGLWVPKGTPKEIVAKLNAAMIEALNDLKARTRLEEFGLQMPPVDRLTPEALGAWQRAEIAKWWPMIKAAHVSVD